MAHFWRRYRGRVHDYLIAQHTIAVCLNCPHPIGENSSARLYITSLEGFAAHHRYLAFGVSRFISPHTLPFSAPTHLFHLRRDETSIATAISCAYRSSFAPYYHLSESCYCRFEPPHPQSSSPQQFQDASPPHHHSHAHQPPCQSTS